MENDSKRDPKGLTKQELDRFLTYRLTKQMETILDYGQVAVPQAHWQGFRSKILRVCNNTMRDLRRELDLELTGSSVDEENTTCPTKETPPEQP